MTENTIEKLLPCGHCGALSRMISSHGAYRICCSACGIETLFQEKKRAVATWNRREADKPKWTTDNPKESGWYYCFCDAFTSVTLVMICMEHNSLYALDVSSTLSTCTPFDFYRQYKQYNLRWLKVDFPALPEEEQS